MIREMALLRELTDIETCVFFCAKIHCMEGCFVFRKVCSVFVLAAMLLIINGNSASALDLGGDKATVAVILDTPDGMFSEPEKVYESIQQSLDKIFAGTSRYEFMSINDTSSYIQLYREENDLIVNVDNGVSNSDSVKPLKKDDYDKICKHFDAGAVLVVV